MPQRDFGWRRAENRRSGPLYLSTKVHEIKGLGGVYFSQSTLNKRVVGWG